ncbi:helix-turn-helix transcriptional regulator [Janibacter indicus]|uniref:Helix-turn-helix transcriptional regulator n=1 Tax=Janibacter indicus TaxID=857417 RepID=A0A7L9IXF3_9MICO|nr:helix-turn-helix transcriptional regulator [Janibacter indicus]QOK21395.1 helix-turn-helix transcriptional regulator [Janibacter indicus]
MTENVQQLAMVRHLARTGEARRRRQAARLSLSEVAAAVGVSEATVSRWERAQRLPKGTNALAFLEVLQAIDDTPRQVPA